MIDKDRALSRRRLLKKAAAVGGAALAAPAGALAGQSRPVAPGRKFRAWVCRGTGSGRTTLQDLTLRPDQRTPGRRPDRSDEPLLLEYHERPRAAGRFRRAAVADGDHRGTRRRRRRRSRRIRGAARAGRRSRLRVGNPAVRQLLSMPARPGGHVPVSRPAGPQRPRAHRRDARRHARLRQLTHRRPRGTDGDFRGMGRADLHESERSRPRHGLQLRRGRRPRHRDVAGPRHASRPARAPPSSGADRLG